MLRNTSLFPKVNKSLLLGRDLVLLSVLLHKFLLLGQDALFPSLARLTDTGTPGLGLVVQLLRARLLSLLLVDVLHEDALVLEHITLRLHVQLVVQVTVDLLGVTVLLQQTTQDTHTLHPQELDRHTGVRRTLALSEATVTTLATSLSVLAHTVARVDHDGLLDDQTVLDQFANVLAWNEDGPNEMTLFGAGVQIRTTYGSWCWRFRSPRWGPTTPSSCRTA